MRLSSIVLATVGLTWLASPVQASMFYAESGPTARPDTFSFKYSSGLWGAVILDGYRTLDGKNFYHDDAPSKTVAQTHGAFNTVGASPAGSRPTSFNPSGVTFSDFGKTGAGFGSGSESFGFGGGSSSGSGGGLSSKGTNPLNFAYLNLQAGPGALPGGGDAGGSIGKVEASATPLPPAWTMMLIGLGCLGFIAFRRQRKESGFAAV